MESLSSRFNIQNIKLSFQNFQEKAVQGKNKIVAKFFEIIRPNETTGKNEVNLNDVKAINTKLLDLNKKISELKGLYQSKSKDIRYLEGEIIKEKKTIEFHEQKSANILGKVDSFTDNTSKSLLRLEAESHQKAADLSRKALPNLETRLDTAIEEKDLVLQSLLKNKQQWSKFNTELTQKLKTLSKSGIRSVQPLKQLNDLQKKIQSVFDNVQDKNETPSTETEIVKPAGQATDQKIKLSFSFNESEVTKIKDNVQQLISEKLFSTEMKRFKEELKGTPYEAEFQAAIRDSSKNESLFLKIYKERPDIIINHLTKTKSQENFDLYNFLDKVLNKQSDWNAQEIQKITDDNEENVYNIDDIDKKVFQKLMDQIPPF